MSRRRRLRGVAPERASWWLYLAAAAFVLYFLVLVGAELSRAEPNGALLHFDERGVRVVRVVEGSPAERAGLVPEDRIERYAGRVLRTRLDWTMVNANLVAGEPFPLEIVRAGAPALVTVAPRRLPFVRLPTPELVVHGAARLAQVVCLLLAAAVAFRKPGDGLARLGAWLLASLGVFTVVMPGGFADAWRQVPGLLQPLLWFASASSIAAPALFLAFCAVFPQPLFRRRAAWVALALPALAVVAWHLRYVYTVVAREGRVSIGPDWSPAVGLVSVAYIFTALALVAVRYRRTEQTADRRRLRVIVAGALIGCVAGAFVALALWMWPTPAFTDSLFASPITLIGVPLLLAFPASIAYTILRYRLFDVRLIVRQGVQYALARRLLLALVPMLVVAVALDLYTHRARALAEVLQAHGWLYAVVGVALLATLAGRRRWLGALDRRFFRERYHAEQILQEVAEQLRRADDPDEAIMLVVPRIARAMQPSFVAALEGMEGAAELRTLASASAPAEDAPSSPVPAPDTLRLPAASRLLALASAVGAPLDLSPDQDAWIARHLPESEALWVAESQVELLVPVTTGGPRRVVLALGPKRSEEPYSKRDVSLLQAIAANLALLLEHPPGPRDEVTLSECPSCAGCFDTTLARCPDDGALLQVSDLPPVLSGRYRLQSRLGAGGMGTVYSAHDQSLERTVAVKVLGSHLVGTPGAAQRFRREAQTAASFTHPHVVTIHDFGVTDAGRAFLVMERLEGGTLRAAIERERRLPPAHARRIVADVCGVLEFAHERSLVHRDLKPENIFLARSGDSEVTKILDFGIAKVIAEATDVPTSTASGIIVGSPAYMSPEQWRGEHADPRWDLWALAIVAFEMLTGSRPAATSSGGFVPAGESLHAAWAASGLPVSAEAFFVASLAPDQRARPQVAREFAVRFAEALEGSPGGGQV